MMAGFGSILPSDFVEHDLRSRFAGRLGERSLPVAGRQLRHLHAALERSLGPATSVRGVVEQAAVPLVSWLGFVVDRSAWRIGRHVATGLARTDRGTTTGLVVVSWGATLDRAWGEAVAVGVGTDLGWCVCTNGRVLRLADWSRGHARRFVEFDLAAATRHEATLAALWGLARAEALEPVEGSRRGEAPAPTACSLVDEVLDHAARHASNVRLALRTGVHEAVGRLRNAFCTGETSSDVGTGESPTSQALTLVYRILFLLYAEARALVPGWHPVYRDAYSLDVLSSRLACRQPVSGLWDTLQAVSRLAHAGCRLGSLEVVGFNGRLFAPEHTPAGETAAVPEATVRDLLLSLTTLAGTRGRPARRLVYRDLDVEQLGAVYEHLLDELPATTAGPSHRERPARTEPDMAGAGTSARRHMNQRVPSARSATASFYTPRSLTEFLVRRTLHPLVSGRSPEAMLSLAVLDPAMGSGAFLVAACRYLASAYEASLVDAGECRAGDIGDADRARFRRLVAQRCLYGVDLNPMAVQLARLSLWLVTLSADAPLSFLDHRLRTGHSLVGASPHDLARQAPGTPRRRLRRDTPTLFETDDLAIVLGIVVPTRERLALDPDDTIEQVRQKERLLADIECRRGALGGWRRALDAWCAGWFWPGNDRPAPRLLAHVAEACRGRTTTLPRRQLDQWLAAVEDTARIHRFFHWPIEFPEVFFAPDGTPRDAAGFDAVVGNPPWDVVRADRGSASDRGHAREAARRLHAFARESGIYDIASDAHMNQYQLFIERSLSLLRPGGRLGLVVPWGLAGDHGSRHLRRRLFERCDTDTMVAFDNRRGIFPIHRGLRFVLVTSTTARPTRVVACRLGEVDPAVLDALPDGGAMPADFPVRFTPGLLSRVSGATLAVPFVQTSADLDWLARMSGVVPALADPNGWGASFGRELNVSDDRVHFTTDPTGLPIVEGKHLSPFRVDTSAVTRFLPHDVAQRRLEGRAPHERARLGYRDVAASTNRLTLIAAIVPAGVVTVHTVFCLKPALPEPAQWALCALLNSFVANVLVRFRVTTHVSAAFLERVPVPRPADGSPTLVELERAARHLARHPADRLVEARLQALVARLYGLTTDEFTRVLDALPLVDPELKAATLHEWRRLL